jgi:virion structural protein
MFVFDDEFGLFDEDVIFNNEDILHEAPNDDNKKENKGQNGSGDNTDTEDDAPTDYTDGSESPNTPVDDEGNPDYTEEEEPDYDEESGNDPENDQTNTDSESDDTNTEVKSDEGDGEIPDSDNADGNIDTDTEGTDDDSDSPDYTSEEDPSAAEGEPGDDTDGAGDEEAGDGDATGDDMGGEDTTDDTSGDTTEGGDGEISQLQNDLFSNLSDEQMKLRINSIKDSFIELYSNVDNTSKQILLVNRSSDNIVAINYINETLGALKDMIRDALTVSFGTRSIAENQIVLQKLVAIYSLVYKIVEKIGNRKEEK